MRCFAHVLEAWLGTVLGIGLGWLSCLGVSAQSVLPLDVGTTVNGFQDNFSGSALGANWVTWGASVYSVSGGLLHITPATGDPCHLLCELPGYSNTVQEVLARIRVTSFGSGDLCRGGVAVGVSPATGLGINYLFRGGGSEGQSGNHLAMLADHVAWGPGQPFAWQTNLWYWLRLRQEPNAASQGGVNDVFAKAWLADGNTAEPANWQLTWDYTPATSSSPMTGFSGLTASSGGLAQFDVDYILIKAAGLPAIQVSPSSFVRSGAAMPSFPADQSTVPALRSIEVHFNQAVSGVVPADLLVNNLTPTNVTAYAPWQYVFDFPEPPMGGVSVNWATNAAIRSVIGQTNVSLGSGWSYTLDRLALPPSLEISEFMAANQNTLLDQDGDSSDWIEIYNGTGNPVNLAGWFLSVEPTNLTQWAFPGYVLASGDYLVVFASGKNRTAVTNELHTNFKLPAAGSFLALVDSQTNLVSCFAPAYPAQQTDVAYGRDPVLLNAIGYFPVPTPGDPNLTTGPGFTAEPLFSRVGGTFVNPFSLSVSEGTPNAVIRYTLDNTMPTDVSPVLAGLLAITNTVQVRARAFAPSLLPGLIHSATYLQISQDLASTTSSLPALIIYNFGAGVPSTAQGAPDQFASFSFYEPTNGTTRLTNAPTLSSRAGFHVRGSSTRGFPKQAWTVQFWDDLNNSADCSPLELPPGKDWALYAPDSFEPVLIHNPLIYQLSNEIARYAPRTRLLEVYINTAGGPVVAANYNGIYVLEEKINRGADRIDIDKLQPDDNGLPAVTGGYMLRIDRLAPGENGFNAAGQTIVYGDPVESDITTPERAPQAQYIQNYMNAFGAALNGASYTNSATGYAAYIDVNSWIDHHILNVMAFNVDTLRLSAYFYKPRQGKIIFGPIWDFDRSQGSTDGRDFSPFYWRAPITDFGTDFFNYTWWGQMFTDIDFWQKWIDRYQDLRTGFFSTNHIYADIDALVAQTRPEQPREIARWPGFTTPRSGTVSISGYSYTFPGTYQGEVDFLKQWYRDRLLFMDTNFLAKPVFSSNGGLISPGLTLSISGPAGATTYYCTDGTDPRLAGGGISPKARVYSGPIPLTASATIMARSRSLNHQNLTGANNPPLSSPWSGYTTAVFGWVTSPAQLAYTNPGSIYAQTFDALPNSGLSSVQSDNPVTISGVTYSLADPFGLAFPAQLPGGYGGLGLSNTLCGWYGMGALTGKVGASAGDQSTGGLISFGSTNSLAASTNRALGLLATSSTGPTAFGVRLINATSLVLNQITLHFTGELWRQSAVAKRLSFGYFIDPVTTNGFPTNVTAAVPSLDVSFPTAPGATTPVAVDGTAAVNQSAMGVTGQAITNWPPGAALWLLWSMADATGKGQGLAIDDLTFSASTQPVLGLQGTGANLVLSWPYGHLQSATNAPGPFSTVSGAASPFTVVPAGARQFYRVVVP